MSKLILIRGNSGSGKTSVAAALQKKLGRNTLLISQDVIRREMLWVSDGQNTQCLPLLQTLLEYGARNCSYVILEGILNATWYRPLFETAQALFGPDIFAYYYDLPFEETLTRHSTRDKSAEFGEEAMRRWWSEKDYISFLPEKVLTRELSLEAAVALIYSDAVPLPENPAIPLRS